MNSLEALKTIFINCKDLLVDKNGNVVKLEDLIKTIKQDLERLEVLEKKNKTLTNKVEHLQRGKNRWLRNFKCERKENTKLKQAIDILKIKLKFEIGLPSETHGVLLYKVNPRYMSSWSENKYAQVLTPKEYELLKEVLENG